MASDAKPLTAEELDLWAESAKNARTAIAPAFYRQVVENLLATVRDRDAKLALAVDTLRVYAEANGSPPGRLAAETLRRIEEG